MAEMTAAEAIEYLRAGQDEGDFVWQIAALIAKQHQTICNLQADKETLREIIEQQQQQIEQLKCCGNCKISKFNHNWENLQCGRSTGTLLVAKSHKCDNWEGLKC